MAKTKAVVKRDTTKVKDSPKSTTRKVLEGAGVLLGAAAEAVYEIEKAKAASQRHTIIIKDENPYIPYVRRQETIIVRRTPEIILETGRMTFVLNPAEVAELRAVDQDFTHYLVILYRNGREKVVEYTWSSTRDRDMRRIAEAIRF